MSYRVVHYINQFFAQIGGEEMAHIAPELREGAVGPGTAFDAAWNGEAKIVNTIICGDSHFAEHEKDAKEQILNWVKEINPDLFIAGPAFNAGRYGYACANIALAVKEELGIPVLTGMYEENPGADLKDKVLCLNTGMHRLFDDSKAYYHYSIGTGITWKLSIRKAPKIVYD